MKTITAEEQKIERVMLTLVSKADQKGLVTRCSLSDIMDYAYIPRQDEVEKILGVLEARGNVRVRKTGTRKREFQMVGDFEKLRNKSMVFVNSESQRVADIQNRRAQGYIATKNLRTQGNESEEPITVLEMQKISNEEPAKWKFDIEVPEIGVIRDCVFIDYPKNKFIAGPSKGLGEARIIYIDFELGIKKRICESVEKYINKAQKVEKTKEFQQN